MWEAKHDRTGDTHGGCGDCSSLSWAVRLCLANGGTAQVLYALSPKLWYRAALWTAQFPTLPPATPAAPSAFSYPLLNCKAGQGDETVWKIPSTPQHRPGKEWGEWERRLEFLYEIFITLVAIPQRAALNQKMGKHKISGPTNWDGLRSMKWMSSCPHPAANAVIQPRNQTRNPGYANRNCPARVTNTSLCNSLFCSSKSWKHTFSLKIVSYWRPEDLPYSCSSKFPLQPQTQLRHQQAEYISKCPNTEHIPCVWHPQGHPKENIWRQAIHNSHQLTPNYTHHLEKGEDMADALCSI